jgi:hypothetical protein
MVVFSRILILLVTKIGTYNLKIAFYIVTNYTKSNSPFLKDNGADAPKGPSPIVFKEWRDTRTFANLKSTHCTFLIVLIINLGRLAMSKIVIFFFTARILQNQRMLCCDECFHD